MNCKDFVDFLTAYVTRELPEAQRSEFRKHIVDCPPCVNYLDTYEETVKMEKAAFRDPAIECDEIPPQLVQAILAAKKKG